MKGQNGITLVALVITVIVMLILAGVAISVLTSDGGLFRRTVNAANAYEISAEHENRMLTNLINYVDTQMEKYKLNSY